MRPLEVPLTPLALVERGFEVYPDRPAVQDGDTTVTYAALRERVCRLAGALLGLGVRPGDRVALLAPNTAAALECYTGTALAGAVLVPLNIRLSDDDYAYILGHSGARVLLVDESLWPRAEALGRALPHLTLVLQGDGAAGPAVRRYEDLLAEARPAPWSADGVDERAPITLNYTSGTTARPKGVLVTHRGAMLNAVNMVFALGLAAHDVHLHVAPMFHANGWGFVWATLAVGAANVPLPRVTGRDILGRCREMGVTTLCAAPTVLRLILAAAEEDPRSVPVGLRVGTAGGAPPPAVIRRIEEELSWHVVHMYGLTETTAFAAYCEEPAGLAAEPAARRAAFKGRQGVPLLLSGRVRVVRPDGTDVKADGAEMGQVLVRGNVVMGGYHDDPVATAEALAGGWLHTGDLAVRHPDGYLEIRDRLKDVIKSGGEQIPSVEVEAALSEHPAVADVAVVAAPDPHWGETPVAFVVLRPGAEVDAAALERFCRGRLAHFKVPRRYVFVDDLPRTGSGKVRKAELRRAAADASP